MISGTIRRFSLLIVAFLALTLTVPAAAQNPMMGERAMLRFVHVISGASAFDIYTDGELTVRGLDFGGASTYINVTAGTHTLTVTQGGVTTALFQQEVTVANGDAITLIASSTNPLGFQEFQDDLTALALGNARLTAIHAIAGGPTVDVILEDGRPVIPGLVYNQPYGTLDIPTMEYAVAVVPEGQSIDAALIPVSPFSANTGTSYMLVAYGTPTAPALMVLSTSTLPEDEQAAFVRFVHGVPGAPAIDIYIDEVLAAPSLMFGSVGTEFAAITAGEYDIAVRVAGEATDVLSGALELTAGEYITAAAIGTPQSVAIQRFTDTVTTITSDAALLNIINTLPEGDTVAAVTASGTAIIDDALFNEATTGVTSAADEGIILNISSGGATTSAPLELGTNNIVYGGVYYSALVISDEGSATTLPLRPVSFAQTSNSAPGDSVILTATVSALIPTPTTGPATVVSAVAQPTVAPIVGEATQVAPEVTAIVTAPEAPATAAPTVPSLPTARVLVDATATLQLRQFPSATALSLGRAPSGTVLTVQGRQGLPSVPANTTPVPEATEGVDPASLLAPGQDLAPADVWLFVTYDTPDGGTIDAWVNALYLGVSDPAGLRQRLANLPTIPSDTAGEAFNTAILPPTETEDFATGTIFSLSAGVNLNIRRTIGTDGEALARVPNNTTMALEGVNEDQQWVFVRYTPPEGGTVRGWVSALYTTFALNEVSTTLEALEAERLLVILPDDTRGSIEAALIPGAAAPTRDPLINALVAEVRLDVSANLNLRRRPNVDAEALARIPSGTQVVVNGRTVEGEWLEVTYEGVIGFVSSQFVVITQNGAGVPLSEVPILTVNGTPISGTPVPIQQAPNPVTLTPGTAPAVTPASQNITPISAPVGAPLPVGTDDPNLDPIPGG